MNSISVDNECFYSDHIVVRKPDLLTYKELKRVFLRALPHEYRSKEKFLRSMDNKSKEGYSSDHSSWGDRKVVLRPRKRC